MLSPAAIRERIFVEVDRLRTVVRASLEPSGARDFRWLDCDLWIDRSRCLVIARSWVVETAKSESSDRLPDTLTDELKYWTPRYTSSTSWAFVRLLAAFVVGKGKERTQPDLCADFINMAVVQPLVNPPFDSLFWLGVDWDLDTSRAAAEDLSSVVGPIAFDMARYPESKSDAPRVRDAQVAFVQGQFEPGLEAKWRYADDSAWAAHCAELWRANQGRSVFSQIASAVHHAD